MCLGQSKHRRDLLRLQIAWRIGSGTLVARAFNGREWKISNYDGCCQQDRYRCTRTQEVCTALQATIAIL